MISVDLFNQMFEGLNDVVLIVDNQGSVVYANRIAKEHVLNSGILEQELHLQLQKITQNNFESTKEISISLKRDTYSVDGKKLGDVNLFILRKISHFIKTVQDLNESERLFRALFENSPGGIIMMSPDLKIMAANKYFCSLMGVTFDSVIDTSILDTIFEQDRELYLGKIQILLNNEMKSFECEKRIILGDNTQTTVLSTV